TRRSPAVGDVPCRTRTDRRTRGVRGRVGRVQVRPTRTLNPPRSASVVVHMTELFDPAALVDAADDPGRYVERFRFSPLLVGALVMWIALDGVSGWLAVGAGREFLRELTAEPPAHGA